MIFLKKSLKQLIQALLICLIVPSTLLLQKNNPYIDYELSYQHIFRLILCVIVPIVILWSVKEAWRIIRKK